MILLTATDNILPISNAKENSLCSRLLLFFLVWFEVHTKMNWIGFSASWTTLISLNAL